MTKRKISSEEETSTLKKKQIKELKVLPADDDVDESENEDETDEGGETDEEKPALISGETSGLDNGLKTKPDWKVYKAEKKDLKVTRKKSSCTIFETTVEAKKIWETFRRSDCPKEKQEQLLRELHALLKGHYIKVVYTHDLARIVQWIVKTAKDNIQSEVTAELKPSLLAMVQQKYSSFCIAKMLESGSKTMVKTVIDAFIGHTVKLMSHNIASKIVTIAYTKYATAQQKNYMKQDFYGELFKLSRNDKVQCLEDAFKISATMKDGIIASTKANITKVLTKGQVGAELVHTVLRDLLSHLVAPAEREELLVLLRPALPALPTSKHGAWLSMHCLWTATPKERKSMMKGCKDFIKQLACHEFGHLTLLAMMDCVDDTVLLSKIILASILEEAHEYAIHEHGRKVILYLTGHRDTQFFHPQVVSMLKEGDGNCHSKKAAETRRAELLEIVSKPLLQTVAASTSQWVSTYPTCMVTFSILKYCQGSQLTAALEALTLLLVEQNNTLPEGEMQVCAIEHLGLHKMLRKLIEQDKLKFEQDQAAVLFSQALVGHLQPQLSWWLQFNRGAFLLVFLLESNIPGVDQAVREFLQPHKAKITASKTTGAKILLKKLSEKN